MIIYSNECNKDWGEGETHENNKIRGLLILEENKYHINAKELSAAKYAINIFVNTEKPHVKLMFDNTTTVYRINLYGW